MAHKHTRKGHSRLPPAVKMPAFEEGTGLDNPSSETISPLIQILCEAMDEGKIQRVRGVPPVFMASTYAESELMMQLFIEFYENTRGSPGPVGFDTETTTQFVTKEKEMHEVSLIQIATQDICLFFQIYNIMGMMRNPDAAFPPRLKKFLEDPQQLLLGVGSLLDAQGLNKDYGLQVSGVIDLQQMAAERHILGTSLADLDALYGRPGREVIKTKKLLGWNWDKAALNHKWVWYAAKDAFAGVAIYENMLANKTKEGYQSYAQRNPLTVRQTAEDILAHLIKHAGVGRPQSVNSMLTTVSRTYPRFQKMYQPEERYPQAQRFVQRLLREGKIIPVSVTNKQDQEHQQESQQLNEGSRDKANSSDRELCILRKNDLIMIPGLSISEKIRSPEGLALLSTYFNRSELGLSSISPKGNSVTGQNHPEEQGDEDLSDLRLFLDLSTIWNRPHRLGAFINVLHQAKMSVESQRILKEEVARRVAAARLEWEIKKDGSSSSSLPVSDLSSKSRSATTTTDKAATTTTSTSTANATWETKDDTQDKANKAESGTTVPLTFEESWEALIDRSTLLKPNVDKEEVKRTMSAFLDRLCKRQLITKDAVNNYDLTRTFKAQLESLDSRAVDVVEIKPWTIVVPGVTKADSESEPERSTVEKRPRLEASELDSVSSSSASTPASSSWLV
ncbi:hypothetical protein BGZ83_010113 [Gryganskiella cystojenkinii]|nr:hypothetical protein BGZ83_010113 [Gryganskiella cystojenkinii]